MFLKLSSMDMISSFIFAKASIADAPQILALQQQAFQSEAKLCENDHIPPLTQLLHELQQEFLSQIFLKVLYADQIVASVRAFQKEDTCYIHRLIVHPDYQNRGIGQRLMLAIENEFSHAKRFELFTGAKSPRNLHLYEKLGYHRFKEVIHDGVMLAYFEKSHRSLEFSKRTYD